MLLSLNVPKKSPMLIQPSFLYFSNGFEGMGSGLFRKYFLNSLKELNDNFLTSSRASSKGIQLN